MRKMLFATAAIAANLLSAATLDGVAAKVDDAVITYGEVMGEMRRAGMPTAATFREAYSNAVEEAIDRRLILRAAADRKLDMQEWVVDNRVREIVKDNFGGDMNKLNHELARSRTPIVDWRNRLRDDMIVQAMRFQLIDKQIEATPGAMQDEYLAHRDRYATKATVSVRVILLRPAANGSKEAPVAKRGAAILAALKQGRKFADLAVQYSADSHAKDGGLWKDVEPAQVFRPEMSSKIATLKVGEVSSLMTFEGGWGCLIRKEGEIKGGTRSFAEAYEDIARNVRKAEGERLYLEWVKRLRADAFVQIFPMPEDDR